MPLASLASQCDRAAWPQPRPPSSRPKRRSDVHLSTTDPPRGEGDATRRLERPRAPLPSTVARRPAARGGTAHRAVTLPPHPMCPTPRRSPSTLAQTKSASRRNVPAAVDCCAASHEQHTASGRGGDQWCERGSARCERRAERAHSVLVETRGPPPYWRAGWRGVPNA